MTSPPLPDAAPEDVGMSSERLARIVPALTVPRLAAVLRRFADGTGPAEIAVDLCLSYGTVRNYLAAAVTKLDARNRVDAVRIAAEAGWF